MTPHRHVMPINDLVEHTVDEDCVCGPRQEPVKRQSDGAIVGYVIIHSSLDGREKNEKKTEKNPEG